MWSAAEDSALCIAVQRYGRRWQMIVLRAPELSGRSAQSLRHYWNSRPTAVMPTPTAQPPLIPSSVVFAWPPFPAPISS